MALNHPAPNTAGATAPDSSSQALGPSASRMLTLLLIAPVVAAAVRWGRPHYLDTWFSAMGLALLSVAVFGWPALFWLLDHGRTRLVVFAGLGAIAGLLSPLAVLATGILGQFMYGDATYVRSVLEWGAPLPWHGTLRWTEFIGLAAASAIAGAVSAVVYWLLFVNRGQSLVVSVLLSAGAVAAGAGLSMLLP